LCLATAVTAQTASSPKPRKRPATITAADVQACKDAIAAQSAALAEQQQIPGLRDELQRKDQAVRQATTTTTDAATKAAAAEAAATQQQASVVEWNSDVTDLFAVSFVGAS